MFKFTYLCFYQTVLIVINRNNKVGQLKDALLYFCLIKPLRDGDKNRILVLGNSRLHAKMQENKRKKT